MAIFPGREDITIGNDKYINVTPNMTANNAPAPYAVTVYNRYSSSIPNYKVFTNTWKVNEPVELYENGYIILDFGENNALPIEAARIKETTCYINFNATFYGSNDNVNWVQLSTPTRTPVPIHSISELSTAVIKFDLNTKGKSYRYIKYLVTDKSVHKRNCTDTHILEYFIKEGPDKIGYLNNIGGEATESFSNISLGDKSYKISYLNNPLKSLIKDKKEVDNKHIKEEE